MASYLQRLTYVEDDADIRTITEIALSQIGGYTLDVCASGPEAISKVVAFGPDMIILDVMMPGMDGIETFARLREIPEVANTPIIFMTAKAMPRETEFYRSLGAAEVIAKPFNPLTLSSRVQNIWRRSSAGSATPRTIAQ